MKRAAFSIITLTGRARFSRSLRFSHCVLTTTLITILILFMGPGANGSPNVKAGPNNYLENLDFALMLSGEARKNKWSVFTDVIYLDFSAEGSTIKSVDFVVPNPITPKLPPVEVGASLDAGTKASLEGIQRMGASFWMTFVSAVLPLGRPSGFNPLTF